PYPYSTLVWLTVNRRNWTPLPVLHETGASAIGNSSMSRIMSTAATQRDTVTKIPRLSSLSSDRDFVQMMRVPCAISLIISRMLNMRFESKAKLLM
ncbi:hypothetical protein PENTCL1PPCAC_22034, partial [Pristionchus entomophagus]